MKITLFLLLIAFASCCAQKADCVSLNKTIEALLKDDRVLKYLHPEIKERIPYTFSNPSSCTGTFPKYNLIASQQEVEDSVIKIIRFETVDKNLFITLFYPLEGVEINAVVTNKNGEYQISDLRFFEKMNH